MEVEIVIQGRIGIARARMGIKGIKVIRGQIAKTRIGMDLVVQRRIGISRM